MIFRNKSYPKIKCLNAILIAFTLWVQFACIDNTNFGPIGEENETPNLTHNGYWIVNEGGFTFGQASLSFLDLVEDTLYNNVFESINKRPLGDVLESIVYYRSKGFLVVNNSQKIEVVDSITFESIATISGLNSPRNLIGYKNKIITTDLYSNIISVFNAETFSKINEIETGGWNDDLKIIDGKLFVIQQQTFNNNLPGSLKGLWKFDAETLDSIAFLPLAQGANSFVVDKNNKIWVLCDGGLEEEIGAIYRINPVTMVIEQTISFENIAYSGNSLQINNSGDKLYFILSDPEEGINAFNIFEMPITASAIPEMPFFEGNGLYIYGFYIDETNQELLFTDAVGLIQEGFCYRIDLSNQTIQKKYTAGIFPSKIYPRY